MNTATQAIGWKDWQLHAASNMRPTFSPDFFTKKYGNWKTKTAAALSPTPVEDTNAATSSTIDANVNWHENVTQVLGNRLFELLRCSIEDGETLPSLKSLTAFNLFFSRNFEFRMPLISTDDDGQFVATWRLSREEMLSIRFIEQKSIEYALAVMKNGHLEHKWGEGDWQSLAQSFPCWRDFAERGI